MTTMEPAYDDRSVSGRWGEVRQRAGMAVAGMAAIARSRAIPVTAHIRDHFYSIAGLGCISAAGFMHSIFTGLLVTGAMVLIFEWKVSD